MVPRSGGWRATGEVRQERIDRNGSRRVALRKDRNEVQPRWRQVDDGWQGQADRVEADRAMGNRIGILGLAGRRPFVVVLRSNRTATVLGGRE